MRLSVTNSLAADLPALVYLAGSPQNLVESLNISVQEMVGNFERLLNTVLNCDQYSWVLSKKRLILHGILVCCPILEMTKIRRPQHRSIEHSK